MSLIHVGKLLTTLCHRAKFKSNNVNLHFVFYIITLQVWPQAFQTHDSRNLFFFFCIFFLFFFRMLLVFLQDFTSLNIVIKLLTILLYITCNTRNKEKKSYISLYKHTHTHIQKTQPTLTDPNVYKIYIADIFLCIIYKSNLPHFAV